MLPGIFEDPFEFRSAIQKTPKLATLCLTGLDLDLEAAAMTVEVLRETTMLLFESCLLFTELAKRPIPFPQLR